MGAVRPAYADEFGGFTAFVLIEGTEALAPDFEMTGHEKEVMRRELWVDGDQYVFQYRDEAGGSWSAWEWGEDGEEIEGLMEAAEVREDFDL